MYSVKNVRSCRGMEDDAFSATLCRDGKPVALVTYGGTGGPYSYDWMDFKEPRVTFKRRNYKEEVMEFQGTPEEALFQTHVFNQPKDKDSTFNMYPTDDMVVGELVDKAEAVKKATRLLKTHLLYCQVPNGPVYSIKLNGRKAEDGFKAMQTKYPKAVWLRNADTLAEAMLNG